ncbi:hypothetical protein [Paenibacillus lutimineralis]|uniref:Uncharacterized protein n=1 Tax=Paenibacillus lutimineralis TaxID=2707005 RepID=A0A3Q9IA60_9BACL|nr:hypothetical protein [Paenibacillus lutimineralis]AZS14576.1 hypothetical protein EI981_09005 [Paenibacillus lutimineralis]
MTLVAAFASPNFAVMVADRRRSQLETGVQIDDVKKIYQVNNNVMVGFSGVYLPDGLGNFRGMAEKIINDCSFLIHDDMSVESIINVFRRHIITLLDDGISKDQLEVTYHIAGLLQDGHFGLGRISCFEDFEPVITKPPEAGITWGLSRAVYAPSMWLESRIASLGEMTLGNVQKLAVELVEHTAQRDSYISDTYDMLTLSF